MVYFLFDYIPDPFYAQLYPLGNSHVISKPWHHGKWKEMLWFLLHNVQCFQCFWGFISFLATITTLMKTKHKILICLGNISVLSTEANNDQWDSDLKRKSQRQVTLKVWVTSLLKVTFSTRKQNFASRQPTFYRISPRPLMISWCVW